MKLRCVTCDVPAKALVKSIKLRLGYYGCDKCTQDGHRVIYPEITNLTLRTDKAFRDQSQEEHHLPSVVSPFCQLPINMIEQFPGMHQCCLGVMRKLIIMWLRGPLWIRLSSGNVQQVNLQLLNLKPCIQNVFARKPRGLEEIDRWKATELRQFAFYKGKIVLKGIISDQLYEHFLVFIVALSILVCPRLAKQYSHNAEELLAYFVKQGRHLYEFLVYNVHSLVHLASNANLYGSLDEHSAFSFENSAEKIGSFWAKPSLAGWEAAWGKRQTENDTSQTKKTVEIKQPNNVFTLSDREVVAVFDETEHLEKILLCRVYDWLEPFFMKPCDSRLIGVYTARDSHNKMKLIL